MPRLQGHTVSAGFRTVSLRAGVVPMGHVLNVDHFHMSEPTFPPHPHAGFTALTWMLPWSAGAFINRDSAGDRSRIGPGALHASVTGAGMMHEEIPEAPGVDCAGLQIFVKLPEEQELGPPRAFHVEAADVPTVAQGGSTARVLVGALDGVAAELPPHGGTLLAHVHVTGAFTTRVPEGHEAFAFVLRGAGRVAGAPAQADDVVSLAAGDLVLEGTDLHVLVGWSAPMARPPRFQGPFCMFQPARLDEAVQRYRRGGMGQLAPSFGR